MLSPCLHKSPLLKTSENEKEEARKKTAALLAKNKQDALRVLQGAIASMEARTPISSSQLKKNLWI